MPQKIEVLPNKPALIARSLSLVLEKIQVAVTERGRCSLALSGGSTPRPLYEALATQALPWEKIHLFWGDERYVPPTHPDSNLLMTRESWIDRIAIPAANVHPMPTLAGNPEMDAQSYEAQLRQFFEGENWPSFDLILLGMGDDGHTASLFPQTQALSVRDRWVTVGNKDGQPRITLTVPLINQARTVIFLVSGENKRPALAEIFSPIGDELTYPSRLIEPQGELWWLLDEAAGGALVLED
jgi:6-phosphogluconolactonase